MKSAFIIVCCLCVFLIFSTVIFWEKNFADRKTIAQKNQQIQQQLNEIAELKTASISKLEAEVQKNQTALVCGIYEWEKPGSGIDKRMDFRSDGTVVSCFLSGNSSIEFQKRSAVWTLDEDKVEVGNSNFKIEGDDLIDSQGNRWLRIR